MKHRYGLFVLSLLFLMPAFLAGQVWAPVGATWHYTLSGSDGGGPRYNTFTSLHDTMIHGRVCRVLKYKSPTCSLRFEHYEYMYLDSSKLFFFSPNLDTFFMLYDFSAQAGASWSIPIYVLDDTAHFLIDSTTTVLINSIPMKVQYFTLEFSQGQYGQNGYKIYENLGGDADMFPWEYGACDMEHNWGLRCYEDSIVGLIDFGIAPSCTYVGLDNTLPDLTICLFPNPCGDLLHVSIDGLNRQTVSFKLIDLSGIEYNLPIKSIKNDFEMDLSSLAQGIYFLCIYSDSGPLTLRKIIKL